MNKVLVEVEQSGVARVTLNNPEKHNAFDDEIIQDLTNAFVGIASNPDVRLMILSSIGKNFSGRHENNFAGRHGKHFSGRHGKKFYRWRFDLVTTPKKFPWNSLLPKCL